jgi:ribosome-associated protein YbcJ (S4-like RNA binding protein)
MPPGTGIGWLAAAMVVASHSGGRVGWRQSLSGWQAKMMVSSTLEPKIEIDGDEATRRRSQLSSGSRRA